MKNKLILFTIAAAALAVSADCQAMMRRAPVRTAKPVAPKVPQRSFSFSAKKDFNMPHVPVAKVDLNVFKKHKALVNELSEAQRYEKLIKNVKKQQIAWAAIPLTLMPAVWNIDAVGANIMLSGIALTISKLSWENNELDVVLNKLVFKASGIRETKTIETELEELVAEQKRQLRTPDDIQ